MRRFFVRISHSSFYNTQPRLIHSSIRSTPPRALLRPYFFSSLPLLPASLAISCTLRSNSSILACTSSIFVMIASDIV